MVNKETRDSTTGGVLGILPEEKVGDYYYFVILFMYFYNLIKISFITNSCTPLLIVFSNKLIIQSRF